MLTSSQLQCVALCILLSLAAISCAGSGNPITPGTDDVIQNEPTTPPNERNARRPESVGTHVLRGVYTLEIDPDARTVEVRDNRELAMHLDVRGILQSNYWCPAHDCIQLQILDVNEDTNVYQLKATLANPTWFTGFDVRAIIFYDHKGHDLLNADDYTMLYEDGTDINPFIAYATDVEQRQFAPYTSHSEILEMYLPPVPGKFFIDFAIDASWPQNCEEPYIIDAQGFDGNIFPDDPDVPGIEQGEGTVYAKVRDWQVNIREVSIDTTPITGDITVLQYNPGERRYEAEITNSEDAPPGDYVCLIAAFSTDDPSLGIYDYLTITVDETPVPDFQTIYGHVGDSFFLDDLDGAYISVTNHDPEGHTPEPVSVVDGEYTIHVVAGTYDVDVESADKYHRDQTCSDVEVSMYENVHLDFGLHNPMQTNPYDPMEDFVNWREITGFAGRVTDGLGLPVPNATVEISSPDSWAMSVISQEFIQSDLTDDEGYFSILNVPVVDPDGKVISDYMMHVYASGYLEQELGPFDAVADHMEYQQIQLDASPYGAPLWTDSFEDNSGWTFGGYYHRQQYDSGVVDISYGPPYEFLAMPPDDECAGSIIPPADGDWYLWYGVPMDGNYLGEWNQSQDPYSGGLSTIEHRGWADSPILDLEGFTEVTVEMDVAYEIECQLPGSFDAMRFSVVVGGDAEPIYIFNPFVEAMTHEYVMSQRGYNRAPMWCHYSFDLSEFVEEEIRLRFEFCTNDSRFNGGRGQFIDNIRLYGM